MLKEDLPGPVVLGSSMLLPCQTYAQGTPEWPGGVGEFNVHLGVCNCVHALCKKRWFVAHVVQSVCDLKEALKVKIVLTSQVLIVYSVG